MLQMIHDTLEREYGITLAAVQETKGGWSASAFFAKGKDADYFVKVYDKGRASIQRWIRRVDDYMPVVLWLRENTRLGDSLCTPVLTLGGSYKVETETHLLLVFPFLHGKTLDDSPLTEDQVEALARIMAALHNHGEEIPVATAALRETYALPFLDPMKTILAGAGQCAKRYLTSLLSLPYRCAWLEPYVGWKTDAVGLGGIDAGTSRGRPILFHRGLFLRRRRSPFYENISGSTAGI